MARDTDGNKWYGKITSIIGGFLAKAGNIVATTGDIIATAGDIIATAGDVTVTAGDVVITAGIIKAASLAEYADDAAAKTGGLAEGDFYRTSAGVVMVVLAT